MNGLVMRSGAGRRRGNLGLLIAALVTPAIPAGAATFTGNGGNSNWDNAANWDPDVPAPGEGIVIADTTGTNTLTLNDAPHTIGGLQLGDSSTRVTPAFTINGSNALTFTNGLTAEPATAATGTYLNLTAPVVIQGDQTWTIRGSPGSVVTDAGVAMPASSNAVTFNGKLIKSGVGQLFIIGRNIGNGSIDVNQGALKLNAGSSTLLTVGGTGTITVNTGGTLMIAKNSGTLSLTKAIAVTNGGTISVGGNNVPATIPTVGSPINWEGSTTFNLTSNTANQVLNFTGNWTGSGTITTTSGGTGANRYVILSGDNSGLSAQFTNNVTLAVGSDTALGTGIYRAHTATSVLRSADANARVIPNLFDVASSTTLGSAGTGDLTFTATGTNDAQTGIWLGGGAKAFTILNAKTTFSGTVTSSPTINALTKAGTGILELSGPNTYDRPTTVTEGTLRVSGAGRLGTPANTRLVTVADAGLLDLQVAALADGATLSIDSTDAAPEINIAAGVNDVLSSLIINGATMPAGTYGSSLSIAGNPGLANPDDLFSGTGQLTVLVPEPGSAIAIALAGTGLLLRRRRASAGV